MSAGRLVTLLRSAVLSPERMGRFHPSPPVEHDAYRVQMSPNRIQIRLLAQGTIDSHTKVYLTHINHCHTADHETLQKLFDESGLPMQCTVAYDGLEII